MVRSACAVCGRFFLSMVLVFSFAGIAAAGPAEDVVAGYNAEQAEDYERAVMLYERAAAGGNEFAMNNLGDMYYNGRGVQRSWDEAIKWYRQGAEKGNPDAQHALAIMVARGEGTRKNAPEAVKWYTAAANQGLTCSQNALGVIFTTGERGVEANPLRAYYWFSLAGKEDSSAASRAERAKARLSEDQIARAEKAISAFKPK